MPRRRQTKADLHAARELGLYIENDSQLYHSRELPIQANLTRKLKKGTYQPKKAEKLFGYLVDAGAKKYAKEFATEREWNKLFTPPTRRELARQAARGFEVEHRIQNRKK